MPTDKYLLIKAVGAGFWYEMHHVLGQLLAAELTKRIPVVYWGSNCLYSASEEINAFEQFFLPVSGHTIHNLMSGGFTYFPQTWNSENLCCDYPEEPMTEYLYSDGIMNCSADVLVQKNYVPIGEIMQWVGIDNPLYQNTLRSLYRHMLKKYIRLRPEIIDEIDSFYNENMSYGPVVAVHVRGSDKISEVGHLHELNGRYPAVIDKFLKSNPSARIFLMTDCKDIVAEYEKLYGNILILTDCNRVLRSDAGVHYQDCPDKMRIGIEIVKDTWLAARCDCFIGNGHSNVSMAISELKDWQDSDIELLY